MITNSDRAAWAATAVNAFASVCPMEGESDADKAKDLATNLFHYLRLVCGLDELHAKYTMERAIAMAEIEAEEDADEE